MTRTSLGELVSVRGGGTPRKDVADFYGGDIAWVTPKDMKSSIISGSSVTLTHAGVGASPAKLLPAGAVLVVVRSGVLKHTLPVALTDVPVTVNQDMKALVPKAHLDAKYLAHMLRARSAEVLKWVRATTADNFPIEKLLELELDLPPIEEQRRIAAILDHADRLGRQAERGSITLSALVDEIFRISFGSDVERRPISEVLRFKSGVFLPASAQTGGEVPVYGGNGINGFHEVAMFDSPVVVVGRVGAYCGAVHLTKPKSWVTDNALYVAANPLGFNLEFLARALSAANLNQYASQSGQPLISAGRIAHVEMPVPSKEQQAAFHEKCSRVSDCAALFTTRATAHRSLFTSLQARAFSGRL